MAPFNTFNLVTDSVDKVGMQKRYENAVPNDNPHVVGYFSPGPEGLFLDIHNNPSSKAQKIALMSTLSGVWMHADSIHDNGEEVWAKVAPPSTSELRVPEGSEAWMCVRDSAGLECLLPANGSHG